MTNMSDPIFHDEAAAIAHIEASRWPDGVFCPHCGSVNVHKMAGKTQAGYFLCNDCRDKFTVRTGSVFERSHIPLHKWLYATHLMAASKKGVSAHQLHRMLGITYKSAWFMAHRIREAMSEKNPSPLGGEGKFVEVDETVIGGKERNKRKSKRNPKNIGAVGKQVVFSLVERGGKARSHHVANVTSATLRPIIVKQVSRKSALMADDAGQYRSIGPEFARYETVNHGADEYVRGEAHTNTIEGFFSIMKRGINGVYHHVSEAHLKRYLAEFDFRYNTRSALGVNDGERAAQLLKGAEGKRLTYRQTD